MSDAFALYDGVYEVTMCMVVSHGRLLLCVENSGGVVEC